MEKRRLLLIILCIALALSGCQTQSSELDERFVVGGIGVDVRQGSFTVLLLSLNESKNEETGGSDSISGEGDTLHLALSDAAAHTDKKLYFGHCAFVVYGSGEALRRAGELSEMLLSSGFLRANTNVLLCETRADVLLQRTVEAPYGVCGGVETLLNDNSHNRDVRVPLYSVVHAYKTGTACFLPYVTTRKTGETTHLLQAERICVYGPENKPMFLSPEESDAALLLCGRLDSIEMHLPHAEQSGVFRLDSPIVGLSSDAKGHINVQVIASLRTRISASSADSQTASALLLENRIESVLGKVLVQHRCDLWGLTHQSNATKSLAASDVRRDDIRVNIRVLANT